MHRKRTITSTQPTRSNQHWCNLCNAPCATDEALRDHYRQCHPAEAALLEQLASTQATVNHLAPAGPGPTTAPRR